MVHVVAIFIYELAETREKRSSAERINSQAKDFGIERPKVRNGASVANLNTLTYIVINLRALQRIRHTKEGSK